MAVTIVSAENGRHTGTTGQAATPRRHQIAASPIDLAKTGSVLVLNGHRAGEKMAVTLVKVFRHPQPASLSDRPRPGDRLYAVQFRFDNTGSVAYSNSPSKGALVDSVGHSYQSSLDDVTECHSFPGTEKSPCAAPGSGASCLRCGRRQGSPGSGLPSIPGWGADRPVEGRQLVPSDSLHYVWQKLAADRRRHHERKSYRKTDTDPYAKADVTIRASSDPGSPYYEVYVTPGNGPVVQSRDAAGDNTGLAVTSHNTGQLSTAVFNSVSVSPLSH